MPSPPTILAASLAGALSVLLLRRLVQRKAASLPPGPSGWPLIGNVLDMPAVAEWLTFAEWGAKWGAMCSVTLLGQPIVILNSASAMEDMDTKGAVVSTRPRLPMAGELLGYVQTLVLMPYGSRFRIFRKHFAKLLGTPGAVRPYIPLVEAETHRFLRRLLSKPDATLVSAHLRKLTGAIILRITYGIEVQEEEDPFITIIEKANDNFNAATAPGAFLVDVFPAMMYIPEFLAPFKRTGRRWAVGTKAMVEAPYLFTQRQMSAGIAPGSFVSSLLDHEEKLTQEEMDDIKHTAASLYGGGADTTAASLYAFFLAMVLAPDVQHAAQAEIDSVIGGGRLPVYADREQLPYVSAVVTELFRWHSVAPLGVPHAALEDTVVNGYFLPKGTLIIANLWNILNDPATYPAPAAFDPSRYLSASPQRDPRTLCFGFGRRVCPGRELAEMSLFTCVATTLAVFDIAAGEGPVPVHENTQGTISHPKPFDCVVRPRSERAVALISGEA
ncbi:cytochrome P450 [Mycena belliarum]|uniref:Cytochrome P450 n=1 Tax=Mycena belliarum TaxID=1033014 RepID=A0AAD6XRT7_9AGAR|nr:cytochrome P450 [Mycena belliae]